MGLALARNSAKMVEASDVVVYHHRRPLYHGHLRQVWRFGLHRGFFVKKFPENSRKLTYFMPSLLILGLIGGLALSLLFPVFGWAYVALLVVYLVACVFEGLRTKNLGMVFPVFTGIILTHLVYGVGFLKGLFARDLRS